MREFNQAEKNNLENILKKHKEKNIFKPYIDTNSDFFSIKIKTKDISKVLLINNSDILIDRVKIKMLNLSNYFEKV